MLGRNGQSPRLPGGERSTQPFGQMAESESGKVMTENHLSDDRLAALFYGEAEDGDREHLKQCRSCSERYGELTESLEALDCITAPNLSAVDKRNHFDAAWRSSGLDCNQRSPGFLWPFLRHCGFIHCRACVRNASAGGDRNKIWRR